MVVMKLVGRFVFWCLVWRARGAADLPRLFRVPAFIPERRSVGDWRTERVIRKSGVRNQTRMYD